MKRFKLPFSIRWGSIVALGLLGLSLLWWLAVRPGVELHPSEQEASDAVPASLGPPPLSVALVEAQRQPIQAWVFAEGTARSVRREYLTFEATGRVTFVGPEKPGVTVEAGELLASLDQRTFRSDVDAALASIEEARKQVEAAAADTAQASTSAELASRQFERIQQLFQQNAVSRVELEEAQAAMDNAASALEAAKARARATTASIAVTEARLKQSELAFENAEIRSPIDGIVAYLNIEEGYYFTQSFVKTANESEALETIPIVVIDPSQYEIIVDIPSFDARRIEVGQNVIVLPGGTAQAAVIQTLEGLAADASPERTLPNDVDWKANAVVFAVNPAINPGGRSVQVKIRTTGDVSMLRDGMFVTCWIATVQEEDAVVAPLDAFLYEENQPYVFVYQPDSRTVERRPIRFGIAGLARREIASGVKAGEQLVTTGRYKLVDGTPVRPIDQ